MDTRTRNVVEMAARVSDFNHANPHENAGHAAAVAAVDALIAQARALLAAQRQGVVDEHNASTRKREIQRTVRTVHLPALAGAARLAAREQPDLAGAFPTKPSSESYLAFRSTAGSMAELATRHKDELVKHGLAETVFDSLTQALGDFDAATQLGAAGRARTSRRRRSSRRRGRRSSSGSGCWMDSTGSGCGTTRRGWRRGPARAACGRPRRENQGRTVQGARPDCVVRLPRTAARQPMSGPRREWLVR